MSDPESNRPDQWYLRVEASTDWATVAAEMDGLPTAWADDSGLHVIDDGGRVSTAPRYCTHLWAWSADRLIRVRIDAGQYSCAVLTRHSETASAPVPVREERGLRLWPGTGSSAAIVLAPDTPRDLLGLAVVAYTVLRPGSGGLGFMALSPF